MPVADLSLSFITAQAGILRASLQLQPNAGTESQRAVWTAAIDRSVALAETPVGPIARRVFGDSWNLSRAKKALDRVSAQTLAAGMFLADPNEAFSSSVERFGTADRSLQRAGIFVLRAGAIKKEGVFDKADRLATALFNSRHERLQTLAQILDGAFDAHIGKLDARVATLPEIVVGDTLPADVAYPRYFEDSHPRLMDYLRGALIFLNDGQDIPWVECRRETIGILIERQEKREGIDAEACLDAERRKRGTEIVMQIPEYSAYQLFCLLRQIKDGKVETALIDELRCARNGRVVQLGDATSAGIGWKDLLRASELLGNIDVIHANIDVAYDLALREQPDVEPEIVRLQVRAAVARLGKATNSSRVEYDAAIAELRRLEGNPNAGRVIPLRRR
ncbi:MAG TPA: hypothetical protein VFX30_10450 [bacterium]|nr:hypothetical protein [bacterium]